MPTQGSIRPRPPRHRSQAHGGIQPLSALTHRTQRFQQLPAPLGEPPYHYDLETAVPGIGDEAKKLGQLVFHTVGDTGGVKDAHFQSAVATAMKGDLLRREAERPAFFYHLGDVVYFNGEHDQYYEQFYEPYDHYDPPILSIPGNHDGDPNEGDTSLDGWVRFFMTAKPGVDHESQDAPRVSMSQPNVYFTLVCPFVTIVGLYSNVPEGGSIDSIQQQWVTNELYTAPRDKALIVAVHHPVYSFDDHHSGSSRMADVLQHAINDSRRVPNMVLTAHVHNYQRIERNIGAAGTLPFLVAGGGGYYHLHHLTASNGTTDPDTQATLVASDDKRHSYVTLTVNAEKITGTMTAVGKDDKPHADADTFSYPAAAQFLGDGTVVSL